jgi:hypothetical protein
MNRRLLFSILSVVIGVIGPFVTLMLVYGADSHFNRSNANVLLDTLALVGCVLSGLLSSALTVSLLTRERSERARSAAMRIADLRRQSGRRPPRAQAA